MIKRKNSSNKRLTKRQTRLINTLEGIGDILVFETKRKKTKVVLEGLERLSGIVQTFFQMQETDPDKFHRLLLAEEFLELYERDQEDAEFRLALQPEKYLLSFSTAIHQIVRVHEAALHAGNTEIGVPAIYRLNRLLFLLTQKPGNNLYIEHILGTLAQITYKSAATQDRSLYASSIGWYTTTVFRIPLANNDHFDVSYLKLFNTRFFASIRYIISQGHTGLFKNLVSTLVDGIHIPHYDKGEIWNYGHLLITSDFDRYREVDNTHQLEKRIIELDDSTIDIDTQDKLDEWLTKFDELKAILEPLLDSAQQENAKELESHIRVYADTRLKLAGLFDVVFAIGAYCLLKNRADYIKYLWEYKQPPDADATWIGHDLLPDTLDGVVRFYFQKPLFERTLDFWEDHRGSDSYYKQYWLLMLARVLKPIKPNESGEYDQITSYSIPALDIYRLSDMESSIDNLIEFSRRLETNESVFGTLGFDPSEIPELFSQKIMPFLAGLKAKTQQRFKSLERDQQISLQKVSEFKTRVLQGFKNSSILRDILVYHQLYLDNTSKSPPPDLQKVGIYQIDHKAAFFDKWHVSFVNWGNNYGERMARGENSRILKHLIDYCQDLPQTDLDSSINRLSNVSQSILIAINESLYRLLQRSPSFKPEWNPDITKLPVNGFAGYYSYGKTNIPVYKVHYQKLESQILVLNTSKLGMLIQESPLDQGDEQDNLLDKILYAEVQSFSENEQLFQHVLSAPPQWLTEKFPDLESRKEYLLRSVSIKIHERFHFDKHSEFEGFKLQIMKNSEAQRDC